MDAHEHSRRHFLKTSVLGGAAALAAPWLGRQVLARGGVLAAPQPAAADGLGAATPSRVAFTTGNDRADLAFRGLRRFEKEIAAAIGDRRIILKPNNVVINNQLAATHADNLEGILEFLKSIGKTRVTIAESPSGGSALEGFANYGYDRVAAKYGAHLADMDREPFELVPCIDERDLRPHATRVSRLLTDPNNFIISATKPKTHNAVIATLSLKNIIMAAPVKSRAGNRYRSDKRLVHGGGVHAINYNLASLAPRLHPDLSVIDGYEGMEGNGPIGGTPVAQHMCIVSQDWLAADRVGLELMGIDLGDVGYLTYCAEYGGLGEANLDRIEILGPALKDHIHEYRLSSSAARQLRWKQPLASG